ncbi:hypothetical protein D3C78_1548080 [compost metagenome]
MAGYVVYNPSAKSEFQDALYGKGMRVANPTTKKASDGQIVVRCTISGKEFTVKK